MERRYTPREELQREKRHSRLTHYLKDAGISLKDFLVWYKTQTQKTEDSEALSIDKSEINSADYALHNFRPQHKWKEK